MRELKKKKTKTTRKAKNIGSKKQRQQRDLHCLYVRETANGVEHTDHEANAPSSLSLN